MPDGSLPIEPVDQPIPPAPETGADFPLMLLAWLSPSFPIGAFAYSHGLEWAAEAGSITDRASLQDWLADLVVLGSLHNDLVLLASAWRATTGRDASALNDSADLAAALQPGAERRLETITQGNSFVTAVTTAWPCEAMSWLTEIRTGDVALPIAIGVAAAGHGIALGRVLEGYGLMFVSNLVSASIRLSVIGHTDGQRIIAALMPAVIEAAGRATASSLDDLGGATWGADLASLHHETQYTRLFRS